MTLQDSSELKESNSKAPWEVSEEALSKCIIMDFLYIILGGIDYLQYIWNYVWTYCFEWILLVKIFNWLNSELCHFKSACRKKP